MFVLAVTRVTGGDAPVQPVENYRARSLGGSMTAAYVEASDDPLRWVLYDVDLHSGEIRWEQELHTGVPSETTHQKSSFASETPVTDGEQVYVALADVGIFALDFEGKPPLVDARSSGCRGVGWGAAASPVLHDGRLYLVNDNEAQSFVAAYSTETGAEVWRTDRDEVSSWATPYVWENDVRTELVTTGTGGVRSYSLEGELLWSLTRDVVPGDPDPVLPGRAAVHQLRIRRGLDPTALRDPSGRRG